MEYTKEYHLTLLAKVQATVDCLLALAEEYQLQAGKNLYLVSKGTSIQVTIGHTVPFEPIHFFTLRWGLVAFDENGLNIQYNAETRQVSDSAKFNTDGTYAGSGHIQYWIHSNHKDEDDVVYFNNLLQSLNGRKGTWKLCEPSSTSISIF